MNERMVSYNQQVADIEEAPTTWIPGLLRALVKAAVKKNVFNTGQLVEFAKRAEEEAQC